MFNFGQHPLLDLAMKCLMVVGGFAAGYVFAMIVAVAIDKLVTHGKSPQFLHTLARYLGGLIVAAIVALLVFRGVGDGGGVGDGTGPESGRTTDTEPTAARSKPTAQVKPSPLADVEPVRVKVLAGTEVERGSEKFYQLGDQGAKVDRSAVTAAVAERKRTAKGPVVVVYEFGREAGPRTIAFTELKMEVEQLGVQVLAVDQFRELTQPK